MRRWQAQHHEHALPHGFLLLPRQSARPPLVLMNRLYYDMNRLYYDILTAFERESALTVLAKNKPSECVEARQKRRVFFPLHPLPTKHNRFRRNDQHARPDRSPRNSMHCSRSIGVGGAIGRRAITSARFKASSAVTYLNLTRVINWARLTSEANWSTMRLTSRPTRRHPFSLWRLNAERPRSLVEVQLPSPTCKCLSG